MINLIIKFDDAQLYTDNFDPFFCVFVIIPFLVVTKLVMIQLITAILYEEYSSLTKNFVKKKFTTSITDIFYYFFYAKNKYKIY